MIVIGTLYVAWQMHRRASAAHPGTVGTMPIMEFVRGQLVRQRDALAGVFWWYLLPFIPGMVVMIVGSMALRADEGQAGIIKGLIGLTVTAALFVGIWWLNQWGARKLQKNIDDIDALMGGSQ
jgi:hypothetical protein